MKKFVDIVRESEEQRDLLDATFQTLETYISGNIQPDNWQPVARILRQFGYAEPVSQNRFYRAIFHKPTETDLSGHVTIGDFFHELQSEVRFDMQRAQGFTTSFDKALDFIHSQYHIQWYRHEWPRQHPDTPLGDIGNHSVAVVYEITTNQPSILWSMRGIKSFLTTTPRSGPGYDALLAHLEDEWTGYGGDDEVFIDTSVGTAITGLTLYDSDDHGPLD